MEIHSRTAVIDGLSTSYLEAGHGDPVVLLHGGEFGISAEIGWEATIPALAERYRVLAPDMLGFGQSAKVIDFNDGRGMRIRHIARFCAELGVEQLTIDTSHCPVPESAAAAGRTAGPCDDHQTRRPA